MGGRFSVCVVLCVYLNMYIRRGGLSSQNGRLCRPSFSRPLLNFRIFTREAKGGGGVNYRYISHNSVRPQKKEKKRSKKKFHDSSMANCRWGGRPLSFFFLFLFRDGAENERKWRHKFVKLFRVSYIYTIFFFFAFSHTKSLIGCWNSRVPWRHLTLCKKKPKSDGFKITWRPPPFASVLVLLLLLILFTMGDEIRSRMKDTRTTEFHKKK